MSDKAKKTITERIGDKEYLDAWRQFKDEHPVAYGAAAVLPVTGQAAAIADYADAMDRGDSVDGAIAAASFIPGIGLAKVGSKIAPASLRLKSEMNIVEKAIAPATKRAQEIGLVADGEQIGEALAGEGKKIGESQKAKRDAEYQEFLAAWGERG